MFKNVLIALKEDLDPQPLLDLALQAADPAAKLHVVTLIRVQPNEDGLQRMQRAEKSLESLVSDLSARGYAASSETGIVVAAAAADIVRIASERDVDLTVIGLAKRTRVGKALLGSDAQRVLLSSRCPVLVAHLYGR